MVAQHRVKGHAGHQRRSGLRAGFKDVVVRAPEMMHVLAGPAGRIHNIPQGDHELRLVLADPVSNRVLTFSPGCQVSHKHAANRLVGRGPGSKRSFADHLVTEFHPVANVGIERQAIQLGRVLVIMLILLRWGRLGFFFSLGVVIIQPPSSGFPWLSVLQARENQVPCGLV